MHFCLTKMLKKKPVEPYSTGFTNTAEYLTDVFSLTKSDTGFRNLILH